MSSPRFRVYALATLALNLVVVLWGAVVRATRSGAGCGDQWPQCQGAMVPTSGSLETLVEYLHRASSGIALVSVAALVVWAFVRFQRGHLVRRTAAFSAVFIVIEALLGAALVLLRMVAHNPAPARAGWMAAHLLNTWMLVASLALTVWFATDRAIILERRGRVPWLLAGMFTSVFAVGAAGAVAAFVDTAYPVVSLSASLAQDMSHGAPLIVRARMLHPLLAMLAGVLLVALADRIQELRPSPATRLFGRVLLVAYALQMGIGVLNLLLLVPVWMQLVHLLAAEAIWLSLVLFAASALERSGLAAPVEVPDPSGSTPRSAPSAT